MRVDPLRLDSFRGKGSMEDTAKKKKEKMDPRRGVCYKGDAEGSHGEGDLGNTALRVREICRDVAVGLELALIIRACRHLKKWVRCTRRSRGGCRRTCILQRCNPISTHHRRYL